MENQVNIKDTIIILCLAAVMSYCLTGCFSDAGWKFSVGVSPVAAIDERQQLVDKRK